MNPQYFRWTGYGCPGSIWVLLAPEEELTCVVSTDPQWPIGYISRGWANRVLGNTHWKPISEFEAFVLEVLDKEEIPCPT